jgi:hypothetical protein
VVRELPEQLAELAGKQELRGAECSLSLLGECQGLPAAVRRIWCALDQPGFTETGQQLRDGWPGDARHAGELGGRDRILADRAQGKVTGNCQRWLMPGKQALSPPRRKQGNDSQRVRLGGRRVVQLRPGRPRSPGRHR